VVARARDVTHWNALRELGVTNVQRETVRLGLLSARSVLELMGLPPAEAQDITQRFRTHNIALADQHVPHHKDRAKLIAVAREGRKQLESRWPRSDSPARSS
jgi:glutathione-regulated potassium-efflux system ancillary protein KefC